MKNIIKLKDLSTYEISSLTEQNVFNQDGELCCPPHTTQFNEARFIKLLTLAISLSPTEKVALLMYLPKLTQTQVEQIMVILENEEQKLLQTHDKDSNYLHNTKEQNLTSIRQLISQKKQ